MGRVENLIPYWGSWDIFDAGDMKEITDMIAKYGAEAERVINDTLHDEGAKVIKEDIAKLLPSSGRNWSRKKAPARSAMPRAFQQDNDLLAVTIAARGAYHYLYFPDDGSNTRRHAGNQRFMKRGAENATSKVIESCLGKLV